MPNITLTIFAGVVAIGFFLIFGAGLVFAMRSLIRKIQNTSFYNNLRKSGDIEMIDELLDKTPTEFKKDLLLLNTFSKKQIRGLVYSFIKRKRKKMKGGGKHGGQHKNKERIGKDKREESRKN